LKNGGGLKISVGGGVSRTIMTRGIRLGWGPNVGY